MAKLVLFLPDGTTLDAPLTRERTTIGRRAGNDICLPNLAVSGEHAVVVTILGDSFLEDMNSTNGTLVNGESVTKHFLRDRDEIEIGRHKLIYCVDDAATPVTKNPVHDRDFGGHVDATKPFVRGQAKVKSGAQRSTAAPERSGAAAERSGTMERSGTAAETSGATPRADTVEPPIDPPAPPPDDPQAATVPISTARLNGPGIKILTGSRSGTAIALSKAETTLGRPGIQVAAIVRVDGRFRIKPVEGVSPPALNGQPVGAEGADLAPGDICEVAGTRIEFVR